MAGAATFSSSVDSQWVIRIESRRGQSRCGDMHGKCVAIISNGSCDTSIRFRKEKQCQKKFVQKMEGAAAADFFDFKCCCSVGACISLTSGCH